MMYIYFALLVHFTLTVVDCSKDDRVYLMEIKLPTLEHRGENAEIRDINRYLRDSYGVDDQHVFKVIGEPRAIGVLKVAQHCKWERITTTFVYMGVDFFVTALYEGRYYAEDIGVNQTLIAEPANRLDNDGIYLIDVTFTGAENSTKHKNATKAILERVLSTWPEGSKLAYYKVLGQIPTRVLFFSNLNASHVDSLYIDFNCPEMCTMKVTALQYLNRYVIDC